MRVAASLHMKTKMTKNSDEALRVFQKLPIKTKELPILSDSEEHAIGTQKLVLQKKIQQIVKPSKAKEAGV